MPRKKLIFISVFLTLLISLFLLLFVLFFNLLALKKAGQEYFASLLSPETANHEKVINFKNKLTLLNALPSSKLKTLNELLLKHLDGQHKYMLVFQNSEEIRATGGFMGSFALLSLNEGMITELNFYDIYDADGQFQDFVEAPAGVKEYLSEDKGQRLPDANWHPDFPSSSQKIISFMNQSSFENIDGVIAVNLEMVENLLEITGGIYLPDYGMTVTRDNFSGIARADRETFFPGSSAKKDFLKNLFEFLKIKLGNLDKDQQRKILNKIGYELAAKNLQFYSKNPDIQNNFERLNIAGELKSNSELIYLVESNVGINKANKNITREVDININNKNINLEVLFFNNNNLSAQAENLDYINYQRLIISPNSEILDIKINNKILETWDEKIITNSKNNKFKQIGFLVSVPANKTTNIQIEFNMSSNQNINIIKQPGIPPTPYIIISNNKTHAFILDKDFTFELE